MNFHISYFDMVKTTNLVGLHNDVGQRNRRELVALQQKLQGRPEISTYIAMMVKSLNGD